MPDRFRILVWLLYLIMIAWPCSTSAQALLSDSKAANGLREPVLPLEKVPDSQLESRLNGVFSSIEIFRNIKAEVKNGVVLLSGNVLRAEARRKAEELASRFEGVVYVTNRIEIESEVEGRINPAVAKIQKYLGKIFDQLPIIAVAGVVMILFWLLSLLVVRWDAPYKTLRINPLLHGLIRQSLRSVVILIGILLALEILDVTAMAGAVAGAAGLAGLAIGFALREIAENYFAGLSLSLRSPFAVNDWVRIEEHEGRVVRLTSREVVLMTLDGNHVRIPNSLVFKSVIRNYTRNPRRRFDLKVGVGVGEDLLAVQEVGCTALRAMPGVMDEPGPFMRVAGLGDFNVMVQFFGWVDQRRSDFLKVQSEAIRLVKAALDAAGIEMPEPIQRVRSRQILPPEQIEGQRGEKSVPHEFLTREAKKTDVSVDRQLDDQIEEDLAVSDEKNLLSDHKKRRE